MKLQSEELATYSRRSALKMCSKSGAAHIGSSLSVIDILAVLYSGAANISPTTVNDADRDIIILSKGHAAAALYSVLGNSGFFPLETLDDYCANGSALGGHVSSDSQPGVEFSTGSLGHGLPFGLGVALEMKMEKRNSRVFIVLSDGECGEGSNWEAALFAAHHYLNNVVVLIDRNGLQSLATTEDTLRLEPLTSKWEAFGWSATNVNGHDHKELQNSISSSRFSLKPTVMICDTTKGKGVSFMENEVLWHYRSPTEQELTAALAELEMKVSNP